MREPLERAGGMRIEYMSRAEFIQRTQVVRRKRNRSVAVGFAMMGLCAILAATTESLKEHSGISWLSTISCAFLFVGMALPLLVLAGSGGLDGLGLPCATCGQRLAQIEASFAIAT